jgi:hypothetical protein
MPRPKVDPRHRQRVRQACDSCKRRKEKCNGALPCEQCESRSRGNSCRYTECPPSRAPTRRFSESVAIHEHSDSEVRVSLNALDHVSTNWSAETHNLLENSFVNSAPTPKHSRMLKDANGKFSMSRHARMLDKSN